MGVELSQPTTSDAKKVYAGTSKYHLKRHTTKLVGERFKTGRKAKTEIA